MTITQQQRQKANELKIKVCKSLQWDELDYNNYQFETGCEYLGHYLQGDADAIAQLERNRLFWAWWRNCWANRDADYIDDWQLTQLHLANRRLLYAHIHDAEILAKEIYPNGVVLAESYKTHIVEIIKSEA